MIPNTIYHSMLYVLATQIIPRILIYTIYHKEISNYTNRFDPKFKLKNL